MKHHIILSLRTLTLAVATTLLFSGLALAASPNLVAAFFVKGKVGLKWQRVDGATEYFVYRKADADFEKVGTTDDDHYFDVDIVPGATYVYKVAVDDGGTEAFSSEKSVTIPGQVGGFKPPTWSGLRVDGDRILCNWDPIPNAVAYNVFRSTEAGGEYDVVGTTQGSRYADRGGLEKGTTYYYVVSALNAEFEETEPSEEMSIKFGISLEEQEAKLAEESRIVL